VNSACSIYAGKATFNEFFKHRSNQSAHARDFAEVKILDSSLTEGTYTQWTVSICEKNGPGNNNDNDGCLLNFSVNSFGDTKADWLVWKGTTVGTYINFSTGFNIILKDENGDVVDYFSNKGYSNLEEVSCPGSSLPYDYDGTSGGSSAKIWERIPDGVGDWAYVTSGAEDPTEGTGNGGSSPVIEHYEISTVSTGLTCEPVTVTITAHDSSDNPVTPDSGTVINLSTSSNRGLWTGSSVDDGTGSYTFNGTASSVSLDFLHVVSGTVNIDINSGSSPNEDSSEDPDIVFNDTGFRFIDASDNPISTQVSGKTSATHYLQAVRTDAVTQQCVALFPNPSTVAVELAAECLNPSSCAGQIVSYGGNNIATVDDNGGAGASSYTSLSLGFVAQAKSAFTFNYPDAGQVSLHAKAEILDGSGAGTGEFIEGEASFVVKPAGICVEALTMAGRSPLCSTDVTNCSAYVNAGETFTVRVSGKNWVADSESNDEFCDNITTPNFQAVNIDLSHAIVAPTSVPGSFSDNFITISSNGFAEVGQSLSEVGVFTLSSPSLNYLGEIIAASSSANIGRFIPDHFTLTLDAVSAADSSSTPYTYMGQEFSASYTLTAVNTSGDTTVNYDDFSKLLAANVTYAAIDTVAPTLLSDAGRLQINSSAGSWLLGEMDVSADLVIQRDSAVDGPYGNVIVGVLATDTDLVTLDSLDMDADTSPGDDHRQLGGSPGELRYGRTFIPPVYGPEIPIGALTAIPFVVEYWNGSGFVTNVDDNNTVYDAWTEKSCIDGSVTCASVTFNQATAATVMSGVSDINAAMKISRPGNSGDLILQIDVDDWLEFDWSGSGDEDPSTQINFGSYRGHDRIIYWRER
jgi:hypothetical protein